MINSGELSWYPLTVDDTEGLVVLNRQLQLDEGSVPMSHSQLAQRMSMWLTGDSRAIGFYQNAEMVGYAVYRERQVNTTGFDSVYLRQFFVRRDYRRKGFGSVMFERLVSEIWPAGVAVTLETKISNKFGQTFWKSLGFVEESVNFARAAGVNPSSDNE